MTNPKPYNLTPADTDPNVVEDNQALYLSAELRNLIDQREAQIQNGQYITWEDMKQKYNLSL